MIDRVKRPIKGLEHIGIVRESIFIDPLIQPVSVDTSKGIMAIDSLSGIMKELSGVYTICGLSNVSFGFPQRKIINRTFLSLLINEEYLED